MTNDASAALLETVQQHVAGGTPFVITGGGSKGFLGCRTPEQEQQPRVSVADHHGVINYEPTELVMTARSGTPLSIVVSTLQSNGQQLPFDPPQLPNATLGGTLACGLSGPTRPYAGSARDHALGVRVISGKGEDCQFGGEVMKNVAGYDVSRLQVGAYGSLGVLLDVSLKVLPLPEATMTLMFEQSAHDTAPMVQLGRQYLPLTGAVLIGEQRFIRLAGSDAGVKSAAAQLGGETVQGEGPWAGIRDLNHAFFDDSRPTWRFSVPDYAHTLELPNDDDGTPAATLYDWGGAQRWVKTNASAEMCFKAAKEAKGHATRFSEAPIGEATHQPISGVSARLQSELRASFDPKRLCNRGRFHPELDS
jgi:glycolate oxidase FAD binding subunit